MTSEPPGRLATVVVSDLQGSTALGERLDPEAYRAVMTRYVDAMRAVLEGHGGRVAKVIGDAIVTVFDHATSDQDAAAAAATAVVAAADALERLNDDLDAVWGVRLVSRTGAASGAVAADGDVLIGEVMNRATALEGAAPGGGILLDVTTAALVEDVALLSPVESVALKGGTGTIDARQVVGLVAGTAAAAPGAATRVCPECGRPAGSERTRCAHCGSRLTAVGTENRRTVTIVFADPKPATLDGQPLDPVAAAAALGRYADAVRPVMVRHGGTVEKFIGDALMAVFGLPRRHEDDALRAVRAAAEMQEAVGQLNAALAGDLGVVLANPAGVNTGEVVAGDATAGERLVTGDAVNVAARLEQAAGPLEVLLGELTRRLVGDDVTAEPVAPLTLRGKAEPVPAHRLVAVHGATDRRHRLRLIGRDRELAAMTAAFERAVGSGEPELVVLVGDAGVGKSRTLEELLATVAGRAQVLRGRCLSYGEGITYWPLVEMIRAAAAIDDAEGPTSAYERLLAVAGADAVVADRLASIAGLTTTAYPVDELAWAARRLFERLAAEHPVLVLVDDIHWAEPLFLELVGQLVETMHDAAVLFVATARQVLVEEHEAFGTGPRQQRVELRPLTEEDSARFVHEVLGAAGVDPVVSDTVARASGGNPLFLEQLLSMLIDDGRLREVGGRWVVRGDVQQLEVPPSLEALLAARLDALPDAERDVVQPASVIGLRFQRDAVAALITADQRDEVDPALASLHRRELVVALEDASEASHRFQHLLIRDAAYRGLLKERRAVLHERIVQWADPINAAQGRETEFEEILGYHLEQAYRCWSELGLLDDHARRLGADGARRLGSAGRRALERGDVRAAANLLGRAAALLAEGDPDRPALLLLSGDARLELGAFDQAGAAYDAAAEAARAAGDAALVEAAGLERLRLRFLTGGGLEPAALVARVGEALVTLQAAGSDEGLSRAWRILTQVHLGACDWGAAEQAAEQATVHARAAGNRRMATRILPAIALFLQRGPMPVDAAVARCEQIIGEVAADRSAAAMAQRQLASLLAMRGEIDEARSMCAATREVLDELGWTFDAALVSLDSGPIELLAGDAAAAETELRRDRDALDAMGDRNFVVLTAALLAEALYRQGRWDEAAEQVAFSRDEAAPDDVAPQILWRQVAAKLAARRGDAEEALALADEALDLVEATDDPNGQAAALVDFAEVDELVGRSAEARAHLEEAVARYDRKGNRIAAAQARRALAGLAGSGR